MRQDDSYKNNTNLVRAIIGYVDTYKDNPSLATHIMRNGKPAVELSFKVSLPFNAPDGEPYILCGHLDRVVRFQDKLYLSDYKTTTYSMSDKYFADFNPSNQMTLYATAAEAILEEPIAGVIVDACQILVGGERFHREIMVRPRETLEEWLSHAQIWIRTAESYAELGVWPMNDTACSMYGGCEYRPACAAHPKVRTLMLRSECDQRLGSEAWNPLVER